MGGWSTPRPGRFISGTETRYSFCRRKSGSRGLSGRVRKMSTAPGIRSPDRPARAGPSSPWRVAIRTTLYPGPFHFQSSKSFGVQVSLENVGNVMLTQTVWEITELNCDGWVFSLFFQRCFRSALIYIDFINILTNNLYASDCVHAARGHISERFRYCSRLMRKALALTVIFQGEFTPSAVCGQLPVYSS